MSRLQQNKYNKDYVVRAWGILIGCAFFAHLFFFGFLFFNCRDTLDFFELNLSHRSRQISPVFFTPLPIKKELNKTSIVYSAKKAIQTVPLEQEEKKEIIDNVELPVQEEAVKQKKEVEKDLQQDVELETKNQKQLHAERDLYQLISQKWHPPFGVTVTSDCVVTGVVSQNGIIEITDLQSSGVLIFDIAVRSTLQNIVLPHWAYGKTLTIHFA
jgi:hypothetical protein